MVHATGLGKTVLFSIIVHACEYLNALVIEPSKPLVTQNARELKQYARGTMAHASSLQKITNDDGEIIASHWKSQHHDLLITTDETVKVDCQNIRRNLNPAVVIADECHWLYTAAAQRALDAFSEAVILGFTATPDYLTTVAKPNFHPGYARQWPGAILSAGQNGSGSLW